MREISVVIKGESTELPLLHMQASLLPRTAERATRHFRSRAKSLPRKIFRSRLADVDCKLQQLQTNLQSAMTEGATTEVFE